MFLLYLSVAATFTWASYFTRAGTPVYAEFTSVGRGLRCCQRDMCPCLHVSSVPGTHSTGFRLDCAHGRHAMYARQLPRLFKSVPVGCRSPHPPQEEGFKRVVMCSGKVYYELAKKRAEEKKEKEVAIIRLEQVS